MAEYKECLAYDGGSEDIGWSRYNIPQFDEKYAEAHAAEEATEWSPDIACEQRYYGEYWNAWRISRAQMIYDTSDVGGSFEIEAASIVYHPIGGVTLPYFQPKGGEKQYSGDFNFVVVSGENLVIPKEKANYGALKNATESFGECPGSEFFKRGCIELNATGIAAINKGGLTKFGLRHSRDISAIDPNGGEEGNEDIYYDGGAYIGLYAFFELQRSKLILNYKEGIPGQIWIHEIQSPVGGLARVFGYIDENGHRRLWMGKKTGYQYAAPYCLEVGGANFYYSDSNKEIRRIWPQPELEGVTGKLPGQFSTVGDKFSYIDNSGNERRFRGVPEVARYEWL